jgi:hypothetical protein
MLHTREPRSLSGRRRGGQPLGPDQYLPEIALAPEGVNHEPFRVNPRVTLLGDLVRPLDVHEA